MRFRHTDSDEVRNARQQDFLRWAKDGYSTSDLAHNEGKLTSIFAKYTHTDKSLASEDGLIDLFNLVINAQSHSVRTIPFPEYFGPCVAGQTTPCYVYACSELATCSTGGDGNTTIGQPTQATEAAYKEFITPTKVKTSSSSSGTGTSSRSASAKPKKVKRKGVNTSGLEADPGDGMSQAGQLLGNHKSIGLPIYYPKDIVPTALGLSETYCFTITDNCNQGYEPEAAFVGSYPRRYKIDAGGRAHHSYVMTLQINRALGEYYTVQGTTWKNPPILNHPSKEIHLHGKTLLEYDNGSKVALVAFRTRKAVYWVSNSLNDAIDNSAMIAMAAEMTLYVHKS